MFFLIVVPFFIGLISFLTPTGPITILIFKNTLLGKYGKAIMIIAGATIIQFFFSFVAIFLVSRVISPGIEVVFRVISAIVFLILGVHLLIAKAQRSDQIIHLHDLPHKEKIRAFCVGILLTLLNPAIIFSWLAVITLIISFKLIVVTGLIDITIFAIAAILGILTGSFLMMYLVHNYGRTFSQRSLRVMMKILAVPVLAISAIFLITAIQPI